MTSARIYLMVLGAVYLGLGIWCTAMTDAAAEWLMYVLPHSSAKTEFIVVYGGLEVGLGVFFLLASRAEDLVRGGLLLGMVLHVALALFRLGCIATMKDLDPSTYSLLTTEVILAVLGVVFYRKAGAI